MPDASALPLASAALGGRVSAEPRLERMFRAHHDLIWRTLRRLGMNQDAARDGTQQAFLVAAERLEHIRPGAERAFLFGTALRIARSARRKTERYELAADMDVLVDPTWRTDAMTNRQTALELLDRMLLRMDPDLVTVFVLFELEGMSTGEIAGIVGIPVGTAASRLRRARQTFRNAASRLEGSRRIQKRVRRIAEKKPSLDLQHTAVPVEPVHVSSNVDAIERDVVQRDVVQRDVVQRDVVQRDVVQRDVVQRDAGVTSWHL